ncbi:MAG: PKD domain-containing protein [Kibdelosporangium sp.]
MKGFRRTHVGLVAAVATLLGGIAVMSMGAGEPVNDVRLLSGAAWLSSSSVGQVTLLDGSSAEVAAQVQVASPGTRLEVAQLGTTAYAVDQSAGTVRRVDGGTFRISPPEAPIPDTGAGLTAMPGQDVLYTVDERRGVLANTDPRSLVRRGDLIPLAGELGTGAAVVDGAGTLWAIDIRTGDLTYVSNGQRTKREAVAKPGPSVLAIVNGNPVVVDVAARKTIKIDRGNGRPGGGIDLTLRPTDTLQVTGSTHADRLYVVASRGVLNVCDLSAETCETTIPLSADNTYGPAVEAGNQLFLPDYSTGQVLIIDVTSRQITARPTVLSPPAPFQLLSRDGVVFYNDTNSERAGVIQFDGGVRSAAKYDPKDPDHGLSGPGESQESHAGQPTRTSGRAPDRSTPAGTPPARSSGIPVSETLASGTRPPGPSASGSTPPQVPGSPPGTEPELEITTSKATPVANEPITLQVANKAGQAPTSAQWTFGDGGKGNGLMTTHRWASARPTPYLVTVTATMPDGQEKTTSVNVTVSEVPRFRITVAAPAGGRITGGGIDCPATCFVDLEQRTQITLTAQPDATHLLGSWSGACGGRGATCDVTADAARTVSHSFEPRPTPKFTLTMVAPNGGVINAGAVSCPPTCQASFDPGTQVQLVAQSRGRTFYVWKDDCSQSRNNPGCTLTMSRNSTVSATYLQNPFLNGVSCEKLPDRRFTCTADAGPPEFAEGTTWTWDKLGRITHSFTERGACPQRTFEVSVRFAGTSRSATVANCF